jgi:hypothetical protein
MSSALGSARIAVGLCLVSASAVWSQATPVSVNVQGRVQVQWNTTSVDEDEAGVSTPIAASTFETRRVRFGANILVAGWIRGVLESEYALGRVQLRQAWVGLELDSSTLVRAGQFKKPFSLIFLTSSARGPVIERGVRIRNLGDALVEADAASELRGVELIGEQHALLDAQGYLAYELGAEFSHRRGPFGITIGAFNGTGPDTRDENDGKSFAARGTFSTDVGPPLTFGAAWSHRELNWPVPASDSTRSGNAFSLDAELGGFRRGLWVIAEATVGDNLVSEERFTGVNVVASIFAKTGGAKVEGIEPVARISWGDPDDTVDGDAGMLLTPGINIYFFGANRLMLNWDVFLPQADRVGTQHAARAQLNLVF